MRCHIGEKIKQQNLKSDKFNYLVTEVISTT
jgi:hypothetical protein